MIKQIFKKLLDSSPQEQVHAALGQLFSKDASVPDVLENAVVAICESGDADLKEEFQKLLSRINKPEEDRDVLRAAIRLLERYKDQIPGPVLLIFNVALILWEKAINKYSANSKNSGIPPSLDKISQMSEQRDASQASTENSYNTTTESASSAGSKSPSSPRYPWENIEGNGEGGSGQAQKRNVGGQPGHKGHAMEWRTPDRVEVYDSPPKDMPENARRIKDKTHQIQDVETKTVVTEYQVARWMDSNGRIYEAEMPEEIKDKLKARAQYGSELKARSVDCHVNNMMSYERTVEHLKNETNFRIGLASLRNFLREAAKKLRLLGFVSWIIAFLTKIPHVLHVDETGIQIGKLVEWAHICCTEYVTYVYAHDKRGFEALLEMGILTKIDSGTVVVHDCWAMYFTLDCLHALCGSHLVRDLVKAYGHDHLEWANELVDLLVKVNKYKLLKGILTEEEYKILQAKYREILEHGREQVKAYHEKYGSHKTKSETLLKRLEAKEEEYLRFSKDKEVPFTNNTAERGFRMLKTRMKIGGCFKNFESAQDFMLVYSYIETCKKHGIASVDALKMLYDGKLPEFVDLSIIATGDVAV